jgi:hypothetical protein
VDAAIFLRIEVWECSNLLEKRNGSGDLSQNRGKGALKYPRKDGLDR